VKRRKLNRRDFLRLSAGVAAGTVISACAPQVVKETVEVPKEVTREVQKEVTREVQKEVTRIVPATPVTDVGTPRRGGTALAIQARNWNPFDSCWVSGNPSPELNIFDCWIDYRLDTAKMTWSLQPNMISHWEQTDDQVLLQVQNGITFHDGTPVDAAALKFNLDRNMFHPTCRLRTMLGGVDKSTEDEEELAKLTTPEKLEEGWFYSSKCVEIVDPMTVKVHMEAPSPAFIESLSKIVQYGYPVCPTAYNKLGKTQFGLNPVGAGPFRFVAWRPNEYVYVERNPSWWKMGADGKLLPYLDAVKFTRVADAALRTLEMRAGNAHFAAEIPVDEVATVQADPKLGFRFDPWVGIAFRIVFDRANPGNPFQSLKLRQAMGYAMDREAIAKTLGGDGGIPLKYFTSLDSQYLPKEEDGVDYYWYDAAKAKQLLSEAVAENPALAAGDGKVHVNCIVQDVYYDRRMSEMVKAMADVVGFDVTLEVLDSTAMVAKTLGESGPGGGPGYQMCTYNSSSGLTDPDINWKRWMHTGGGYVMSHLDDPEYDRLMDLEATIIDPAKRREYFLQLEQLKFDEPWQLELWQSPWNYLWSKKLRSARFVNEVTKVYWEFYDVWLEA
jgi:peptide/nickel transport system substrate-binding protein